jgi:2-oxo-4-hydroxy-4-carboxy-5-ureidoimidazoline decarboxylase
VTLDDFRKLSPAEKREQLLACCQCEAWVDRLLSHEPFDSVDGLLDAAEQAWSVAGEDEILEAFSGHPQIGDMDALRNKYANTATREQGQIAETDESVLVALQAGNAQYLDKFGFIFIVCATGKSADEMLALLNARIGNSREQEIGNGAREQMAITRLRIANMLEDK